jgi:hypothetical protein
MIGLGALIANQPAGKTGSAFNLCPQSDRALFRSTYFGATIGDIPVGVKSQIVTICNNSSDIDYILKFHPALARILVETAKKGKKGHRNSVFFFYLSMPPGTCRHGAQMCPYDYYA